MGVKLGLRSKIIALSSLLLLLPWFAYQFINEMESFLRLGQQQTLLGTTSAIALSLHERPLLFNEHANALPDIKKGKDLYVYDLDSNIKLDGDRDDWQSLIPFQNTYLSIDTDSQNIKKNNVQFNQLLGKKSGYLFAHFEITDASPIKRHQDDKNLLNSDHLIIALSDPQGKLQRYIISVTDDGWFNAYHYEENSIYANNLPREKAIQGFWQSTPTGYNIEFRLPLTMLGDKLGFQLNTKSTKSVTQQSSLTHNTISTSNILDITQLGSVLIPSPEIEQLLLTMRHTRSRLWVVDKHQRVIAKSGDIHKATGSWPEQLTTDADASNETLDNESTNQSETKQHFVSNFIQNRLLLPIYELFLQKPNNNFIDKHADATQLNDQLIAQALTGKPMTQWRIDEDNNIAILSAVHPIFVNITNIDNSVDRKVVGAVIAEETNIGIVALRNQALQKMFNVLLAAITITAILLFLFTSTVVTRIRQLRNQSDQMIDHNGRLCGDFVVSNKRDEIGDLSRSMGQMVDRLSQYHDYIEQLSARLSHELRTPVAVVRSSLDNLSQLPNNEMQQKYIDRSVEGVQRLNKILTSMSEASRIEETVLQADRQSLDFAEVINGCMQGYKMIYPDTIFDVSINNEPLNISVDPDFLVQVLDKIIHNAIEFSENEHAITVSLIKQQSQAILRIGNKGPLLSAEHPQDLFHSMVSIRPASQQHNSHLGLGLYIAKVICNYHQAEIAIANNPDLTGVVVTITFPLLLEDKL